MITNRELAEVSLSPTKKDYYQMWNEIIDFASKISDRWSPNATNESDPGIVLLKALVAIADKLNYNIDKNTLEAFMPSATQEESMRKLTEMMGYSMKYYQSATCKVTIKFNDTNEKKLKNIGGIYFPKFVNIKNEEEDVNYVTLEDFTLQPSEPVRNILAIEGALVECETNNDNIISVAYLDDNHRYFMPEANVAENGIFIFNVSDTAESDSWKQVDNLNTQLPGTKCFKFGYSSAEMKPYVQFPEDISQLIGDGLRIKYIRTNGLYGNVDAEVLCKLEPAPLWSTSEDENISGLTSDDFKVTNSAAAKNGADPESLNAAYNNYKKIVGTFDTLVTCRDYMNKIYNLQVSEHDTTPMVSNIIVSDIRDDINRAVTLCSFNEYGICYTDLSREKTIDDHGTEKTVKEIEHFDLMLYPFKTIYGLNTKDEYVNSFRYNSEFLPSIKSDLEECKTISHNFVAPDDDTDGSEIACIKNYIRLKAKVHTTRKVTTTEEVEILRAIYTAIYKNFNNRQLDFGEEIPEELIKKTIAEADTRIKEVTIETPVIYTKIATVDGTEYGLADRVAGTLSEGDRNYNKLALRNILAGRIAAFNYDEDFKVGYDETKYPEGKSVKPTPADPIPPTVSYEPNYPLANSYIDSMTSEFTVIATDVKADMDADSDLPGLVLDENEVVQFRMPNLRTKHTYPAYVNYYLHLNASEDLKGKDPVPATFMTLYDFMDEYQYEDGEVVPGTRGYRWTSFVNTTKYAVSLTRSSASGEFYVHDETSFSTCLRKYGALFYRIGDTAPYTYVSEYTYNSAHTYYAFILDVASYLKLNNFIMDQTVNSVKLGGIYRSVGADVNRSFGKFIDVNLVKYLRSASFVAASISSPLESFYIQQTHPVIIPNPNFDPTQPVSPTNPETINDENIDVAYTQDGLGRNADYTSLKIGEERELKTGEYLLINYTNTKTDEGGNEKKTVVNEIYKDGDIIKPNFALMDSSLYHKNHSYSKKDGFYFEEQPGCPGMFTLGTNEQIEIRELAKVELKENGVYLYWTLNSDDLEKPSNSFIFDEPWNGKANMAYTLKEGEHLYYTDSNKLDLAYYGAGTVIVRHDKTPELKKYSKDGTVSEEDIMTYGMGANIPWGEGYDFGTESRKLEIIESQYISLTEGDTLVTISATSNDTTTFSMDLDNNWAEVDNASYMFAEDSTTTTLPPISISNVHWMVRSRLDFNMGPQTPQVLHKRDSITLHPKSSIDQSVLSDIVLKPVWVSDTSGESVVYNSVPLAIYSNYLCQIAHDTVDVTGTKKLFEDIGMKYDFKIKLASLKDPSIGNGSSSFIKLNNYENGNAKFTKFSFEEIPERLRDYSETDSLAFSLNTNILKDDLYGLIMFYYKDDYAGETGHRCAKIQATGTSADSQPLLEIYNQHAPVEYTEAEISTRLNQIQAGDLDINEPITFDHEGIYVIKVHKGVTSIAVYADRHDGDNVEGSDARDKAFQGTIIFSDLSLIKGINPKLDYRFAGGTAFDKMLEDIRNIGIASDFYYNCPIENSNAIDLNEYVDTDVLSSPMAWYDPNNVNNKFVVSEIDADYLSTGITIAKPSRL